MALAAGAQTELTLEADVLIIGGGLAGGWAAISAAQAGAQVILVDKGHMGASGVTAPAGPGHWWVPPDPAAREAAIQQRLKIAHGLGERDWMERILDLTWRTLPTLSPYYTFEPDDQGVIQHRGLRGHEYMRALRQYSLDLGVQILDHSPALELLVHADGSVAGARGERRQEGREWRVRAGGVILASGGVAFKSRLLGAWNNTGDGHLMAAEAGADLSGMEFTSAYCPAPAGTTMARAMSFAFARYFDASGQELDIPSFDRTDLIAKALLNGKVYARFDRMPESVRAQMPQVQPIFGLPFARRGVDPYTEKFEMTLLGEGTVRGIGGVRIVDTGCQTRVEGLYAAGDTATRERAAGASSGGGSVNSSWALSSGIWAGQAAAHRAKVAGRRTEARVEAVGQVGLRPAGSAAPVDFKARHRVVHDEILGYDNNLFRTEAKLWRGLGRMDDLWRDLRLSLAPGPNEAWRARELAAVTACARWSLNSALVRKESRGMHKRLDAPQADWALASRLHSGGLDKVWTHFETSAQVSEPAP